MTVPPIDISAKDWKILSDILRQHVPDHEVWAFGSRAKRTSRTYSDLDIVILTPKPLSSAIRGPLVEDFSESDLPFRIDLLDWHTAPENFRRIAEKDKVVLQPGTEAQLSNN